MNSEDLYKRIYDGELILANLPTAGQALRGHALKLIQKQFGNEPTSLSEKAFREALDSAKKSLASDETREIARSILLEFGLESQSIRLDRVRLRAISPGLENVTAAAPVFYSHRDTWYGNPACQINVWLPLMNTGAATNFRFFLDHFTKPIKNDSAQFRAQDFQSQGGFGRVDGPGESVYPRALEQAQGDYWDAQVADDKMLIFSASHLHQSKVNSTKDVRFSLDFRFFPNQHLELGLGAPDPDNLSQGLLIEDYTSCP